MEKTEERQIHRSSTPESIEEEGEGEALGNGDTGYCYRRRAETEHPGSTTANGGQRGRRGEAAVDGDGGVRPRAPRGIRGENRRATGRGRAERTRRVGDWGRRSGRVCGVCRVRLG
jgi:hypothetical protein